MFLQHFLQDSLGLRAGGGHHRATVARDLLLFFSWDNLNFICGEANNFKAASCRGSDAGAVLSDAAGED
jgi:hypothetical protein